MLKKFAAIVFFYTIFSFIFLRTVWGAGEAGASAHLEEASSSKETLFLARFDLRPIKLKKFFLNQNSLLANHSKEIIDISDKYDVDWALFPAIAGVESGYCRAYIKSTNNCVGWGGGTIYFKNMEDQFETVIGSLRKNYIDQGLTSVDLIGTKYAADPEWSFKVKRNMNEIKTTEIL